MTSSSRSDIDLYVVAALGGAIGASARYAMELLIPNTSGGWPTATFIVNLSGAFLLGIAIILLVRLVPETNTGRLSRRIRPFLVTGVFGGYTTFSTYMVETHDLLNAGQPLRSALYLFGSLFLGVLLVALGMKVGRWLIGRLGNETDRETWRQTLNKRLVAEDEG